MQEILNQWLYGLLESRVQYACLSPGSRHTPLILALTRCPYIKCFPILDERSSSWFALGLAKASLSPIVTLCTSGTAGAHQLPAVMEAFTDHHPLWVITADRSLQEHHRGLNQTIHQSFFDSYLLKKEDLDPLTNTPQEFYKTMISLPQKGPSHINIFLKEPFFLDFKYEKKEIHVQHPISIIIEKTFSKTIKNEIILTVGEGLNEKEWSSLLSFAKNKKTPLYTDFSCFFKFRKNPSILPIDSLSSLNLKEKVILHFGGRILSKNYITSSNKAKEFYQIALNHKIFLPHIHGESFFTQNIEEILNSIENFSFCSDFPKPQKIQTFLRPKEYSILKKIHSLIPENIPFFIGNSTLIRLWDLFALETTRPTFSNRGLSGIEGNIATLLGISVGLKKPLVGILGDLTFIHDISSLSLQKFLEFPVYLFVFFNHGGRIFEHLEIKKEKELEEFFIMPQNISLEDICKGFHIPYTSIHSFENLKNISFPKENKLFVFNIIVENFYEKM